MASERIGDMTRGELEAWVVKIIDKRLKYIPGNILDDRTPMEVFESIVRNTLERQPGEPSTLEMLREDRDR